jgi:serine protease Do
MLGPVKCASLPCLCVLAGSLLGVAGVAGPALAQPAPLQALPPLPGGAGQGPAALPHGPAASPGAPTAQQLYEHVRRGVVAIEHGGVPMAIGTVLGGDGRILTALSGLGGADGAEVRYADGTTVHTKVGVSDKALDLALLVPQSGRWTDGLGASDTEPLGADLRAMLPQRGAHLGPAQAGVKGQVDAHARSGEPLSHLLDVDVKGSPIAGAPLLDSAGSVVAVLVHACKGPALEGAADAPARPVRPVQVCRPIILGAPVSAVRSFLSRAGQPAAPAAPWLGIRAEAQGSGNVRGVRVVAVAPSSPAEKADLRAGDVIVAADGQPIDSPERLAQTIGRHSAGDSVKLLVFGGGTFRDLAVELLPSP